MRAVNPFSSFIVGLTCSVLLASCGGSDNATEETQTEHLGGGETTVNASGHDAFSHASRNMSDSDRIISFNEGNHFFENPWVQGTQSTQARDGLGPYFNSNACQGCHINDGRGHAGDAVLDGIATSDNFNSLLIRVSRSVATEANVANAPDDNVGGQLQHKAVSNVQKESDLSVSYTRKNVSFDDGYTVELRIPQWHMTSHIGEFNSDSVFSARVAPPMIGLGLLELINEDDILNQQDIDDSNNDGISGKANQVWSLEHKKMSLGRFGWKAGQPSLLEQTSGAFLGDMGLTSKFHLEENCHNNQTDCTTAENGNGTNSSDEAYEVTNSTLALVSFYSHHLAVPERRDAYSDQVQQGKLLFVEAGCTACHTESYTTGSDIMQPELSNQVIFPFTDMLLHDMGEDLADFREDNSPVANDVQVEYLATATEWRTPPLWGLGLTKTVDDKATFLHDGRARTIMEAVLWHGGEAETAKNKVLGFNSTQRDALSAFLNDL
ncbi:MAG: c-type cytochrome [Pseudomonadales bacterium]|nr:c-type cytochrome [Pseudomonadales bacterium]